MGDAFVMDLYIPAEQRRQQAENGRNKQRRPNSAATLSENMASNQ